jgi:hypothetical protein
VSVSLSLLTFECLNLSLWYAYDGSWAHLNGVFHKPLSLVCTSVYVSVVSVLGNGSVNTFLRQQIHITVEEMLVFWGTVLTICATSSNGVIIRIYPTYFLSLSYYFQNKYWLWSQTTLTGLSL